VCNTGWKWQYGNFLQEKTQFETGAAVRGYAFVIV